MKELQEKIKLILLPAELVDDLEAQMVSQLEDLLRETRKAALQAAKEAVPGEITTRWIDPTTYGDTGYDANSVYFGHNECRERTLEGISKLEEV